MHVWYAVRGEDVTSSSASHQNGTDRMDTTTGGVMDDDYALDAV